MVSFNKQRVQHDNETKRIIAEEYINTRQSMAQVASKYNINVNTVNNIVKKYKAQKKKEAQFFKDATYSKPKPKPLSVAQEVNRNEHTRNPEKPYQPQQKLQQSKQQSKPQEKPIPMLKPQQEQRKSARREVISINTSNGAPAEPFRTRPSKPKDSVNNVRNVEKKLERKESLRDLMTGALAGFQERFYK